MSKIVVGILQNAWSPFYAGGSWPRRSWLTALNRSRSGQRLRILTHLCPNIDFWWDNTTPIVGPNPNSVVPPDIDHIRSVIVKQNPRFVVTFGKQAAKAVRPWVSVPILMLPHPASRVVTNALFVQAARMLDQDFAGVVQLTQGRKEVVLSYCD